MRTDPGSRARARAGDAVARLSCCSLLVAALMTLKLAHGTARAAEEEAATATEAARFGADWRSWHANTEVTDLPSVQRGARNFTSYCLGCHGLKYERWSRLGDDLSIPPELLQQDRATSPRTTSSRPCRRRMPRAGSARLRPTSR